MAAEKQKSKKKGGFTRAIMKITMAGAALYIVAALVGGRIQLAAMQAELEEVQRQTKQQQEINAELQTLAESGDIDAYIERIARDALGYVYPDERIYIDMTGK